MATAVLRSQRVLRHLSAPASGAFAPFSSAAAPAKGNPRDVVIVGVARTPIGSFQGALSSLSAPELGAVAIQGAINRAGLKPPQIEEVIFGNVLSAGVGQAPARQASMKAGLPVSTVCTTINKVCSSGMKSIMFGAQAIALGQRDIIVCGGMESMSNAPYYLPGNKARGGLRMGHGQLVDGLIYDGLWDPYSDVHMGIAGEKAGEKHGFSRADQDNYAIKSYERAQAAWKAGKFKSEVVPVEVKSKKATTKVEQDEEPGKVDFAKLAKLDPAFQKGGSVTAANSSKISDGAAAVVLTSREKANELGLKILATVRGYGDAEDAPMNFPTTPALAIPRALKSAGLTIDQVDFFEVNEAFAVVALSNMKLLNIPMEKINIYGGAVSLGHPIGCSGARIVITLLSELQNENKKIGVAGICNGGGGASSLVIERA